VKARKNELKRCSSMWRQEGFDDFIQGAFGNAGHNLYVSKAGVLQRIHQFDINSDGYVDIIFCNSHDIEEAPPTYVYHDSLGSVSLSELPSGGGRSGVVADLNGDGFDDLVVGMWFNGITSEQHASIYYGSPEGWSQERTQFVPAPQCRSIAVADFNGDGKLDLAFLTRGVVRFFFQTELGFEPERYTEVKIGTDETNERIAIRSAYVPEGDAYIPKTPPEKPDQIEAADLNGDGFAELIMRFRSGEVRIYWGSEDGVDPERYTLVPVEIDTCNSIETTPPRWARKTCPDPETWTFFYEWATYFEKRKGPSSQMATPRVQVVCMNSKPYIFVARNEEAVFVPVESDGSFAEPLIFPCDRPMAVAIGDINGDGFEDMVIACQEEAESDEEELSWVYWGGEEGFDAQKRTSLKTFRACDVFIDDLDGDGCDDILIGQGFRITSWTNDSFVYHGTKTSVFEEPVRLTGHNTVRGLIARPSSSDPVVVLVNRMGGLNIGTDLPAYLYFGGEEGFSAERLQQIPNWGALGALCCDINDDGRPDIVLANALESIWERSEAYVLLNTPNGIPDRASLQLPHPEKSMCCVDLNRDGYLDLIATMPGEAEIRIYYGTADGFQKEPEKIPLEHEGIAYTESGRMCLADLNNDGWLDLFIPQGDRDRSFILWGGQDGFSMERSQMLSALRCNGGQAADLTGNGYLDLMIGGGQPSPTGPHDSFLYIYWNGPEGIRETNRTTLPCNSCLSLSVADFNNDGLLDIFVSNYWGTLERDIPSYIYWNRRGRGFSATDRTELPTHSASGSIAADFNEDGWVDLAIAYHKVQGHHVGYSTVWWNSPDGFSEKNVTKLPSRGPHGMVWGNPGNVRDRTDEEYYISCAHKLPDRAKVTGIEWEADLGPKTWVKAQLRFAESEEALPDSPWIGPDGEGSWFTDDKSKLGVLQSELWVQYRLALGAKNSGSTPRITSVSVCYE